MTRFDHPRPQNERDRAGPRVSRIGRKRPLTILVTKRKQQAPPTQWAAMSAIAPTLDCTKETLRRWLLTAERDAGERSGPTSRDADRLAAEGLRGVVRGQHHRAGCGVALSMLKWRRSDGSPGSLKSAGWHRKALFRRPSLKRSIRTHGTPTHPWVYSTTNVDPRTPLYRDTDSSPSRLKQNTTCQIKGCDFAPSAARPFSRAPESASTAPSGSRTKIAHHSQPFALKQSDLSS